MNNEMKTYNGWTNYETWCVHLWLTNEEGSYRYWREEAERHIKNAANHSHVQRGIVSVMEQARYTVGQAIKASFETFHPFRGEHLAKPMEPGVYGDLLDSALSEVDWYEIASAFLEEFEPETDPDDEGTDTTEKKEHQDEGPKEPRFPLGQVVSTAGALEALDREEMAKALARHHAGDWGDCGPDDWRENETSLREGFRLFSVYHSAEGVKFWVITDADRSATTVLLPEEY